MRSVVTCLVVGFLAHFVFVETTSAQVYQSFPTQLKKKTIYARAEGQVDQVNLQDNQVFGWDELAVSIKPTKNVRPEFGRAYTDFAGAVTDVLVKPGDKVEKGDPLLVCRFVEHVYASCLVPASLKVTEDQPITATYRGQTFDGKVLSIQNNGDSFYVNVLIYNQHEEHYWHLTHGIQVSVKF